jgi:hypothetical protein
VLTLGAVLPLEELAVEGGQAVDAAREVGTATVKRVGGGGAGDAEGSSRGVGCARGVDAAGTTNRPRVPTGKGSPATLQRGGVVVVGRGGVCGVEQASPSFDEYATLLNTMLDQ